MRSLILPLLYSAVLGRAFTINADGGTLVTTEEGVVAGTLVLPTVRQFLGIPFASAGRWEAPSKPAKRSSILKADKFSDTCLQLKTPGNLEFLKLAGGQGIDIPESENCLTVNIWAPSTSRKQKTAVLLWIYGGAFQFGSSNLPIYDGQNIVRDHDDITIVTFNYRLNIFGQPNAPQLANGHDSQNFGLLDLEAAVQWVHDNIAAFGGDPNRISIFGQSAGSTAADAYSFSHPHDTIVKGIIQQSGNLALVTNGLLANPTLDETSWNAISEAVGCGNVTNSAQFSCMKAIPARTLEDAVIQSGINFKFIVDDITLFSDLAQRRASGNFLRVPVLGGSTLNEGDIFVVASQLVASGSAVPFSTEIMSDIMTQTGFTCNAGVTAQDRLKAKVPTWRYQYQAVFANQSPRQDMRAYHASEIPIVFGTYNTSTFAPPTADEIALSKYMQTAWVAFARNPSQGLVNFGWPLYNPTTSSTAQLGNLANSTGVSFTQGSLIDTVCSSDALNQLQTFSSQLASNFA
ncbi:carboxylesterase [Agrocybe pediades]|nr:carboxylesterase [Agrocybe pediades]